MAINLAKTEEQLADEVMSKVGNEKHKVSLSKSVVNLSKTVVDLSKKAQVDLGSVKAQVVVVMDYSGSMSGMYKDGTVQGVINKMVPLGLTFDDNGEIEVYRFDHSYAKMPTLSIENFENYVRECMMQGNMGGTAYAPVLKAINNDYLGGGFFSKMLGKDKSGQNPVFVIFITDGDNSDKAATNGIITELAKKNCFIQFVGVGNADMSYLEALDDLEGRECDNTGFVRFANINNVDDIDLYNSVLEQFADWLKVKGF